MNKDPTEGLTATKPAFNGPVSPNVNPLDVTAAAVVLGFGRVSPNLNPLVVAVAVAILGFCRASPNLNPLDVTSAAAVVLGLDRTSTGKAGGAPLVVVVGGCAKAVVVVRAGADVVAERGLAVGMLEDPNRNPPDDSAPDDSAPNTNGLC